MRYKLGFSLADSLRSQSLVNPRLLRPLRLLCASSSGMGITKEEVESILNSSLKPSHLSVIDTSGGCGASFEVEIVSAEFEGKRLLERHRMVNTALAEPMKQIHALSIKKALTPAQWNPEPAATEQQ